MGSGAGIYRLSEQEIEKTFPKLIDSGYTVTSPETTDYNCIAWAANNTDAWWWPDSFNLGYWPPGIPRKEMLDAFIKAYELFGYAICGNSQLEAGFEKIAIYADSSGKPAHAARQLSNGCWTSKLGQLEDIEHDTLDDLTGSEYGAVAVIMKRVKGN
jgi:hypothetical protein